jgi:hypothetical protein
VGISRDLVEVLRFFVLLLVAVFFVVDVFLFFGLVEAAGFLLSEVFFFFGVVLEEVFRFFGLLADVLAFFLRGRLGFAASSSPVSLLIEGNIFTISAANVFAMVAGRLKASFKNTATSFEAELPLRITAERVVSNKLPLPLRNSFTSFPTPSPDCPAKTFRLSIKIFSCSPGGTAPEEDSFPTSFEISLAKSSNSDLLSIDPIPCTKMPASLQGL